MRYIGLILEHIGEQTRNRRSDVTPTSGVSDNEILQYLTNAQRVVQSQVLRQVGHTSFFNKVTSISVVSGQQAYPLPADVFYNQKIKRVRYSHSGLANDYYPLVPLSSFRFTDTREIDRPGGYSIGDGEILLNGIPISSQGTLEVTYVKRLDRLDIRRATVAATANDGTNFTEIQLDTGMTIDSAQILKYVGDFLCINDIRGQVTYQGARISAYDSSTQIITLEGSPLASGTIPIGSYVTLGEWSTTHSKLPDECEQFLIEFTDWKIKKGESSEDSLESNQEMISVNDDIISQFANFSDMQTIMTYDPFGDFT